MKRTTFLLVLLVFALAACQEPAWYDSFEHTENEVFSADVVGQMIPADELTVFGVSLGDSQEDIVAIHGEPDISADYGFGLVRNMEYSFNASNETIVLYHLRGNEVQGMLLTQAANPFLNGWTVMNRSQYELYPLLGQPTLIDRIGGERRIVWDELGYELYISKGEIQRIRFQIPDQGIEGAGDETTCDDESQVFALQDGTGDCLPFPNECLVPDDWEIVAACEQVDDSAEPDQPNRPPVLCVQVITPAVDPDSDECVEYSTPCDVPEGWETVDSCEDLS